VLLRAEAAVAIAAAFRKLRRLIWFCGYIFYSPMNLKTINHFEKNRLDIFDLRRVIVHYEFGYYIS
jgi:hypothetical protein